MTREEAIAVLKGLSDNPLFSDQHKAAFSIAIHDIKAYYKWNLNELVLTQKDNEQEPILDKLRTEITDCLKALDEIEKSGLNIYLVKAESEGTK